MLTEISARVDDAPEGHYEFVQIFVKAENDIKQLVPPVLNVLSPLPNSNNNYVTL